MPYISREFIGFTVAQNYDNFRQALVDGGWELFETVSATNHVYRSNCEDGLGPYIYINTVLTTSVTVRYYSYWTAGAGLCQLSWLDTVVSSTTTSVLRITCNKNIVLCFPTPFNGYTAGTLIITRPPARIAKPTLAPVIGGATTTIQLGVTTEGFRVGERRTIYGIFGEGQQEIVLTAINRATNVLTVTGCTNSYATGALVGDYQLVVATNNSNTFQNQLAYNRMGTTLLAGASVYITGKNGAEGAPYAHDIGATIETAILRDMNRYLGEINPTYIKYVKSGVLNNLVQIRNSDEPPVDSVPTSFTEFTLTDTTQTWVVDSLISKSVIFISGTGLEYTRFIIGNTEHTLTFRTALPTIILTTGFRIVDEVYRILNVVSQIVAVKEEF